MAAEDDGRVPGVSLQLLGRFQARRDGREVPPAAFGGRKVRLLLRVLAVRRPDLVPLFLNALPIVMAEPVDISNAVLYLVSDESRYVPGLELKVDAGVTIR